MPWPSMKATMSSFTVVKSSGMGDIWEITARIYCMPSGTPAPYLVRGWRLHSIHEQAIELLGVEIELNFDRLGVGVRWVSDAPGERVAVFRAVVKIHAHVASFTSSDDAGIDPCGGGNLVPHDVGARSQHGETGDVAGEGSSGGFDLLDHCGSHLRLDRNIGGRADDFLPGRAQHDRRRFGIEPEIEFVARIVHKLGIVTCRAQASAHEYE